VKIPYTHSVVQANATSIRRYMMKYAEYVT
jgi:hypothetical protein